MSRNADDTRREILDVALHAFAQEGFASVTTRRIAAAADVNIATLSYHFGSKDGLYRAVVEQVYRRLNERSATLVEWLGSVLSDARIGASSAPHEALRPVLRDAVERMYTVAVEERSGVRILLREVLDMGGYREDTRDEHFVPHVAHLAPLAARILHIPEDRARSMLVTCGLLLGRFAVQDTAALQRAFGLSTEAETHERVIECLLMSASSFVQPPPLASVDAATATAEEPP